MADASDARPLDGEWPAEVHASGAWSWSQLDDPGTRAEFEAAVMRRIATRRWFGAKSHALSGIALVDHYEVDRAGHGPPVCVVLLEVRFVDRDAEIYQLPLSMATADAFAGMGGELSTQNWAQVRIAPSGHEHVLYDALAERTGCDALLALFPSSERATRGGATVATVRGPHATLIASAARDDLEPHLSSAEQSNSSVRFGDQLILKVYRRIEPGINPDWEVNAHLAAEGYAHIPPLVGALEYRRPGESPWTLAILQGFVPNFGDGWSYTLQQLVTLLNESQTWTDASELVPQDEDAYEAARGPIPIAVQQRLAQSLVDARALGERTATMHQALAAATDPSFRPETFSAISRATAYRRARDLLAETFALLERRRPQFTPELAAAADVVLRSRSQLEFMQRQASEVPIHAQAIRIHGDYHLGQVLMTENGPVIIDFEGEPTRPLAQRRERALALRDVAGMIRSFHYASCAAATSARDSTGGEGEATIDAIARSWYYWATASFLAEYLERARGAVFLPSDHGEVKSLLSACILDKAIYELRYELNSRPDWVHLPLRALVDVVAGAGLI